MQVPVTPQNLLQQAQHHVQAGAAAVVAAARNVMDQKRTYVPARVRPISNEVFVPFGLWKELFDGTGRPFPASGLPLRVSVTGGGACLSVTHVCMWPQQQPHAHQTAHTPC